MTKKVNIRASLKDGVTTVKALMTHPMETGARAMSAIIDCLSIGHFLNMPIF